MSAPQNPPAGTPPAGGDPNRAPTLPEMQALAQSAAEAVAGARSAAEAATAAANGIREQAENLNLAIPENVVTMIAEQSAQSVIAQLRAVGALTDDGTPAAGGNLGDAMGATPPPGTPPAPAADPPAAPPAADPPAAGKTFAQRWLGQ